MKIESKWQKLPKDQSVVIEKYMTMINKMVGNASNVRTFNMHKKNCQNKIEESVNMTHVFE